MSTSEPYNWDEPIKIAITEAGTTKIFTLSKVLLIHYSAALKARITPRLKGINLQNVTIPTFEAFTKWLYCQNQLKTDITKRVTLSDMVSPNTPDWTNGNVMVGGATMKPLVDMYIFGLKFGVDQLRRNATARVFTLLRADIGIYQNGAEVERLYNIATPNDILRRLFVNAFVSQRFDLRESRTSLLQYPLPFLVDVFIRFAEVTKMVYGDRNGKLPPLPERSNSKSTEFRRLKNERGVLLGFCDEELVLKKGREEMMGQEKKDVVGELFGFVGAVETSLGMVPLYDVRELDYEI